jgi:pyruvate formate lyase activating enzyme
MVFGGLQKLSLSDYPGRISAILFTRGCGFRCPYCHNPELVDPGRYAAALDEGAVLAFLDSRRGRLDGVVISGGEPTFHEDLPQLLARLKTMGFALKLDTNGSNPSMLRQLIADRLVDFVALDVKAPFAAYGRVAGPEADPVAVRSSIRAVLDSAIAHEVRTTWCRALLSVDEMRQIAREVRGCAVLAVQAFRPSAALDSAMLREPVPSTAELEEVRAAVEAGGVHCIVR